VFWFQSGASIPSEAEEKRRFSQENNAAIMAVSSSARLTCPTVTFLIDAIMTFLIQ
jgi:hypothetical protein